MGGLGIGAENEKVTLPYVALSFGGGGHAIPEEARRLLAERATTRELGTSYSVGVGAIGWLAA